MTGCRITSGVDRINQIFAQHQAQKSAEKAQYEMMARTQECLAREQIEAKNRLMIVNEA